MNRMKKVIAIVILAVIMTVTAAVRITWAEVTQTKEASTESVQESVTLEGGMEEQTGMDGQEAASGDSGSPGSPSDAACDSGNRQSDSEEGKRSFDISDKEVGDNEDVTFDVVDDTKPDISTEEGTAANPVITVTEENVTVVPGKEEEKLHITVDPVQTEPVRTEESQVIVESQKTEVTKPEAQVTVKTEPGISTVPNQVTVNPEKEVTAVEKGKAEEPSGTRTEVTAIPGTFTTVTQEVLPNVVTESPTDKEEPEKKPENSEKPENPEKPESGQRPARHPSGGNPHGPSVIQTVQGPQGPGVANPSSEMAAAVVPNIISVPEKTSIRTTSSLPKTGDTISLHGMICLLSSIGILLVLLSGYKETVLQTGDSRSFTKEHSSRGADTRKDFLKGYRKASGKTMGKYSRYPIPVRRIHKGIVRGCSDSADRGLRNMSLIRNL